MTAAEPLQRDAAEAAPAEVDSGLLAGIRRRISSVSDALSGGWTTVSGLAQGAVDAVESAGSGAVASIRGAADGVMNTLRSGWAAASGAVTSVQEVGRQLIAGALGGVVAAFGRVRQAVQSMDADALSGVWDAVGGAFSGAVSGAASAGRVVAERLGALWSGVRDGFQSGLRGASELAGNAVTAVTGLAHSAMARVATAWSGLRERASNLGGLAGGAARLIMRLVQPLLDRAQSLWSSLQTRWTALQESARGVADRVTAAARSVWSRVSAAASSTFDGIRGAWDRTRSAVSGALDRVGGGIRSAWQRVRGFSISGIVAKLRTYSRAIATIEEAIADPDSVLSPYALPIADQLAGGMPGAAESESQSRMAQAGGSAPAPAGPAVQRQEVVAGPGVEERTTSSGAEVWAGLRSAFADKWRQLDVKKMAIETLKSIVWPWPRIGTEIRGIGTDVSKAAGNLFAPRNLLTDPLGCLHDLWSDLMKIVDIPLMIWRRVNNIGLLLLGPITIALTIIGAIGGSLAGTVLGAIAGALAGMGIGAAPGAGGGLAVGGVAGAGAGFGVAIGVGQAMLYSFVAGEAATLVKVLVDLFTTRQTRAEKADDYSTAADSGLALGITAVLLGLGWIGGRMASACAAALRQFVPSSVLAVIDEFMAGVRRARTGEPPPENKKLPPAADGTPAAANRQTPGPQTLTAGELGELQAVADKYQARIQVTGSRGQGMGRNVETNLPSGKGPGTRSDIDVVIEGQVDIDTRGGLSNDIRNSCGGNTQIASVSGEAHGPHIDINPNPSNAPRGGGPASERPTIPPPTHR